MWNQQGTEDSSLKERVLAGSRVLGCFMDVKVWGEGRRGGGEGTGRKVLGTQGLGGWAGGCGLGTRAR